MQAIKAENVKLNKRSCFLSILIIMVEEKQEGRIRKLLEAVDKALQEASVPSPC